MMTADEQKLEILRKIENGSLSIEEGSELIANLETNEASQTEAKSPNPSNNMEPIEKHETSGCWKAAWSIFLVGGAVLTGFSAYWVYQGYKNHGFGWGFWLSWIPMAIGICLMLFGWALMESPWMHVRVRDKYNQRLSAFVFSMPVPFNIARWVINTFGQYMPPEVNSQEIHEILDQAEASIRRGEPFRVQVDDQKEGSKVDISIN